MSAPFVVASLRERLPRFKRKAGNNGRCANCGQGVSKHAPNGSRLCPGWNDLMDRAAIAAAKARP